MKCKKVVSGLLACVMAATTVFTGNVVSVRAETPGLVVDYDFSQAVDGKIKNKASNMIGQHDATLKGADKVAFADGAMELKNEGTQGAWVEFPTSIMDSLANKEQFTIEAKFARNKVEDDAAWLFCFGSDPKARGVSYLFLCPKFKWDANHLRAGIKNAVDKDENEKLFSTARVLEDEKFYTADLVFDKGTIKLYIDGVPVKDAAGNDSLASGYSIMDDVITPGCKDGVLGYIGKSCWNPDPNFTGKIQSFKIYDGVLTDAEVQAPYQAQFQEDFDKALKIEGMLGKNESKDSIKYNLDLQQKYGDLTVNWTSDKPEVIATDGKVSGVASDTTVNLKAKTESGALTAEKSFAVTVKPADRTKLDEAITKITQIIEGGYCTEADKQKLEKAKEDAEKATSANQTDVDKLVKDIERILNSIDNPTESPEYVDPFSALGDTFSPTPADMTLAPKQTKSVKASAIPENIQKVVEVTYASDNKNVADIDANGNVSAKGLGYAVITTTIKAKSDGYEQEYYTLVKVDVDMSGVKASAKESTLAKGKTTTIDYTLPEGIDAKEATVDYRATGAVSVKDGKVTAKSAGEGNVYVKVKIGGKNITRKVAIKVGDITGASTLKVKKSTKLKVSGISGKVKWSLDKKSKKLAKISSSGKLTAKKKAGKVKVTAKVGNITMTKTIKIKK